MIYKMYCVYDALATTYGEPFVQVNDNAAMRVFAARFANTPEVVRDDMALCYLGEYDVDCGVLIPCEDSADRLCNRFVCHYDDAVATIAKMRGELDPTSSQEGANA